ncbi:MAG: hypothetical protein ACLFR0_05065 [Alphaproteobacteria bacterium]
MVCLIFLGACSAQKGFAPPPPAFSPTFEASQGAISDNINKYYASLQEMQDLHSLEPAAGMQLQEDYRIDQGDQNNAEHEYKPYTRQAFKEILERDGCHIKDRFDRKAVLAYQWGRNLLGLDVDGIGFDSTEIENIKMTYRLKLQPHLSKKESCRYKSSWQGLIGSSYNEFYKRENDTVLERLDALHDEVRRRVEL